MTTIRDIAKLTGYSVSTVSRVINNNPQVSKEKREKIQKVMADLHYVPNRTAQNLSTGGNKRIGVILPLTDQAYFDQLLKGILNKAFKEDYRVTLLPTNYDKKLEKKYLDEFAAKAYSGLIVATRANHLDVFQPYLKYGPIIFCEAVRGIDAGSVHIDIAGGIRRSIDFLKEHGATTIGLTLGRSSRKSCNTQKILALCDELLPDFSRDNIFWNCYDGSRGPEAIAFFKEKEVDGLICNCDDMAAQLLASSEIPLKRNQVIGRDNNLISDVLGFSTVDYQVVDMGKKAVEMLLNNSKEVIAFEMAFIERY